MENFKKAVIENHHLPQEEFSQFVKSYKAPKLKKPKKENDENRCLAKLVSGLQCSRNKQSGKDCCGTHVNKTPFGLVNQDHVNVNVFLEKIDGIYYYIDETENVYKVEDVQKVDAQTEIVKPFAKYVKENEKLILKES